MGLQRKDWGIVMVLSPEQIEKLKLKTIPSFSDRANHNIVQSEIEGGVYLDRLPKGTELEVETENHVYRMLNQGDGQALIAGHPEFCPNPVPVKIHGSTWGGSMLKPSFIGRGMHLEFSRSSGRAITTSRIVEVRHVDAGAGISIVSA